MIFAKIKKRYFFIVVLVLVSSSYRASCSSFEKVLIHLYRTSLELKAQRAGLEAAMQELPLVQSSYRPSVDLQGTYNRTNNNYQGTTGRSQSETAGASAELTQKVIEPKYAPSVRKVRHTIASEEFSLMDAEQSIFLSAIEAYMNLYRDLQVLEVQRANTAFMEKNLEFIQARYDIGDATLTDLSQVKSRLAESKADLAHAQGQVEGARATYVRTIGLEPQRMAKVLLPKSMVTSREELLVETLQKNPVLRKAKMQEKASFEEVRVIENEFLPSVKVVASAGRNAERLGDPKYRLDSASVKAVLSVPFDLAGVLQARLIKAHHLFVKATLERKTAERKVKEEAKIAWSSFLSSRKRYNEFSREIRQSAIALQSVQLELEAGSRNVADVLEARKELLKAQVAQVKTYRDLMVAAYNILKSQGKLTAKSLNLPVKYYDSKRFLQRADGKWWGLGSALSKPKSFMLRNPRPEGQK